MNKGRWTISNGQLYLESFDSIQSFPSLKMTRQKNNDNTSYAVQVYDYFKKPFPYFQIVLLDDSLRESLNWPFTDSTGSIRIAKSGRTPNFIPAFQFLKADETAIPPIVQLVSFDSETNACFIYIDYPSEIMIAGRILLPSMPDEAFTIKEDGLYQKGRKRFTLAR